MAFNPLIENDQVVSSLRSTLSSGSHGLSCFPGLLKRVLEEDMWKERKIKTGEVVKFDRFADFVVTKPLEGLGATPELIESVIRSDPESLKLYRRAMKHQGKKNIRVNNTEVNSRGRAYACDRLERERPDLFEKVKAGELSANAAMIEAGFRKKKTGLQELEAAWKKASATERRRFMDWLKEQNV